MPTCNKCQVREYLRTHQGNGLGTILRSLHSNRWNYSITMRQYNTMLEQQGGVCVGCGHPETTYMTKGRVLPAKAA